MYLWLYFIGVLSVSGLEEEDIASSLDTEVLFSNITIVIFLNRRPE